MRGMIGFGVMMTYTIACYVAIDITWTQYIAKRVEKSHHKLLYEYFLRTGIVFVTCKSKPLTFYCFCVNLKINMN